MNTQTTLIELVITVIENGAVENHAFIMGADTEAKYIRQFADSFKTMFNDVQYNVVPFDQK